MSVGGSPSLVAKIRGGLRPVAWYKFGVGLTISASGKVSRWDDFSGNGHPLLQATGNNQPSFDNKGGITCDGSAGFMAAAFTLAQPATFALLLNQIAWTSGNVLVDGGTSGTGSNGAIVQTSGSPQLNLNAGSSACANTTLPVAAWHTCLAVMNSTKSWLYAASTAGVTGDCGTNGIGGITIGASSDGSTKFGNVGVRECLVFNSALDDTKIRMVRKYLEMQRGIAFN